MAMTKCRDCGTEVSTAAESCPKCGRKFKRTSLVTKIVLGLLVIGAVGSIFSAITNSQKQEEKAAAEAQRRAALTPEQRVVEDKKAAEARAAAAKNKAAEEAAFQKALVVALAIKKGANDPKSVEIEDAFVAENGAVAITFRAKNGFGALVKNYVVAKDGKSLNGTQSDVAPLWNKYIANQKGYDVTSSIRGAMSM